MKRRLRGSKKSNIPADIHQVWLGNWVPFKWEIIFHSQFIFYLFFWFKKSCLYFPVRAAGGEDDWRAAEGAGQERDGAGQRQEAGGQVWGAARMSVPVWGVPAAPLHRPGPRQAGHRPHGDSLHHGQRDGRRHGGLHHHVIIYLRWCFINIITGQIASTADVLFTPVWGQTFY